MTSLYKEYKPIVAIYCRLSEEDRDKEDSKKDSESIQNQKNMLIRHALGQGWEIYKIYSDDDYRGSDRNRPEYNKLLTDAEHGLFNIVLCKSQSRFTRELEMVEKYIHKNFVLWNIRFISLVDNADTSVKGNKKSRQINGLVNEWYLEDLSENIKSVFNDKRTDGVHIGSFALYGYQKDPNQKGHLIIDEEAAQVVREVFTLFSQGYGKTAIARILNDREIPNPTEYKRRKGLRYCQAKGKTSTLWKYFAISNMLTNEMYIGNMVQGKYGTVSYKIQKNKPKPKEEWYCVEKTHDPIIDRELWNRVQALIKQKAKPFTTGKIGIFAHKTKCMNCGYTLLSSKNHGYHYLRCPSRHVAQNACIGCFISVLKLEKAVLDELKILSKQYLDVDMLEKNIHIDNDLSVEKANLLESKKAYTKKINEYTMAIKSLYLDKVKGLVSESDYIDLTKNFSMDKQHLENQIHDVVEQIELTEHKIQIAGDRKKIINQYVSMEKLDREIVEKLINYIEIGKKDPTTKIVPIRIHWNF